MINDEVLHGRIPRLGTITTGYGTEATSQRGTTYSAPTRSETLVFHTNDEDLAVAAQGMYAGIISQESPTWGYDVVTDVRWVDVLALPAGFRQALELWRAAECVRRCDGVTMQTVSGRPADPGTACACHAEIVDGADRACTPSTILPVFVDLPAERFGVWEVRSNSWGTASMLKGTMRALAMVGATSGSVPARLSMVDRQVRDHTGRLRDVVELHLTIAQSRAALENLAGRAAALDAPVDALPDGTERRRLDLLAEWSDLQTQVHRLGLRDRLVGEWKLTFGATDRTVEDLTADELSEWVDTVRAVLAEPAESPGEAPNGSGAPVGTGGSPPDGHGP